MMCYFLSNAKSEIVAEYHPKMIRFKQTIKKNNYLFVFYAENVYICKS